MDSYIKLITTENSIVYINKNNIGGIEEVPESARSEGHVRIYIDGYKFSVRIKMDELVKLIEG